MHPIIWPFYHNLLPTPYPPLPPSFLHALPFQMSGLLYILQLPNGRCYLIWKYVNFYMFNLFTSLELPWNQISLAVPSKEKKPLISSKTENVFYEMNVYGSPKALLFEHCYVSSIFLPFSNIPTYSPDRLEYSPYSNY